MRVAVRVTVSLKKQTQTSADDLLWRALGGSRDADIRNEVKSENSFATYLSGYFFTTILIFIFNVYGLHVHLVKVLFILHTCTHILSFTSYTFIKYIIHGSYILCNTFMIFQ